jgi:hypothetical protein
MQPETKRESELKRLREVVRISEEKILNPENIDLNGGISTDIPVLVILAAGKGTRFGKDPKCIQPVHGVPLARHSVDAFRRYNSAPVICLVGYRYQEVASAMGSDNIYILTDNPAGGTAYATFEAFCIPGLLEKNPLMIITMGDRIVPSAVFGNLARIHTEGEREADLTLLTAIYEPPRNKGKGRIIRDESGKVVSILEEKDIIAGNDDKVRQALLNITEGNCPLYAVRASTLYRYLSDIKNDNMQGQYYITDIVRAVSMDGGDIRTITTNVNEPEYDLLCSDVTQPMDLALLEGIFASRPGLLVPEEMELDAAVKAVVTGRPPGQIASVARQLEEMMEMIRKEKLDFEPDKPLGIGVSGGRLRIAFMHPDMARFFGPAWQMPIGACNESGDQQIVVMIQSASDGRIHLTPMNQKFRETINYIPADYEFMYPDEKVSDINAYEKFGTRMSEELLLSLGYFSDEELATRQRKNQPVPPSTLWVSTNMRRPFALVGNALASLRTLRTGNLGAKIRKHLGYKNFRGLRLVSSGNIPQGGFSSSSALTVATKNAINALFDIGISPDLLVHLASQAEYGTGVKAGSLDQATEQKGKHGQGTLISSNPKDNYKVLGTFPIPDNRIRIIFPYSVERDRNAWRWSYGFYAENPGTGRLTATEVRKMTGKAAEIAAIITRLPLETDFFKQIEDDLVSDGLLSSGNSSWICSVLMQLPLLAHQEELTGIVESGRDWYISQLIEVNRLDPAAAAIQTDTVFSSLFDGWHTPLLRRTVAPGVVAEETGVPLRAIVAYLFGEVAKNFYLIHHPEKWIEYVTLSQRGDCCFDIDPDNLPTAAEMERELDWERGISGSQLLDLWLDRYGAMPFNYNSGLDDAALSADTPPVFHQLKGSNFFRGLALIDLAEAMLKRAFGGDSVALRVNAAGQGDYFQVHLDKNCVNSDDVKQFIRKAFYRRFGLTPEQEFVDIYSGGGAAGFRLNRYEALPQLIRQLKHTASR